VCLAAIVQAGAQAQAQDASAIADYDAERSQTIEQAPPGWVGRKTRDRERRIGKAKDAGLEQTIVLTIGGFARACPTAAGIVEGNFEYAISSDEVRVAAGSASRTRQARRLSVRLEGHVGDDAKLGQVDMIGDFTVESGATGTPTAERRPVRLTFRPGAGGEPDTAAMLKLVNVTSDVATATAVLMGGTLYKWAELEWTKPAGCVEFFFDPPTLTRSLLPGQSAQVRVGLRTKEGHQPVPWSTRSLGPIAQSGSVSPGSVEASDSRAVVTYTASAQPKRGHGIDLATASRAGMSLGQWQIVEPMRFEGSFSQTDSAVAGSGLGTLNDMRKVTGNLVFSAVGAELPAAPSFGEGRSIFLQPSAGDVTVEFDSSFSGMAGSRCVTRGRKTFPITSLPPPMRRYMWLEIADDGRYRLSLDLPDRIWQVWQMELNSVCTFLGGQVHRTTLPVNDVAVTLDVQSGSLNAANAAEGRLPAPIPHGPRSIDGQWSFVRKATP